MFSALPDLRRDYRGRPELECNGLQLDLAADSARSRVTCVVRWWSEGEAARSRCVGRRARRLRRGDCDV